MRVESFLVLYTVLESSLCSETTNSSTELWKLHMDLYTAHCGAAVFCANGTDHMIPAGYPCCLPCSCLSTCEQQHNCCPKVGDEIENQIDTRNLMDEIGQSNNSTLDKFDGNATGSSQLTTIQPSKSNLKESKQQLRNTILMDDNAMSRPDNGVEPVCFRPQVVNRPNWYLDSGAYLMVTKCSDSFKDKEIRAKCEALMNRTNLIEMVPVTSRRTGIPYANKYCLACNEAVADAYPTMWEAKFVAFGKYDPMYLIFHPNEYIEYAFDYGNIHFTPTPDHPVQQCERTAISTCNQTGLWESFDETLENICIRGQKLPILHESKRYKNVACLRCNEGDKFYDRLLCGLYIDFNFKVEKHSLGINIKDTPLDGKTEKGLVPDSYLRQAVLPLPKTNRCPSGYIALLGYCRRVMCPRDQYISNGKCVPLYQQITGLGINVQIDVLPSKPIQKEVSSEFLDKLTTIYNASLARHVTLKIRHISVWFGPKGSKVRDRYYMFDLYLFNTSETIDYSTAVDEIKNFFQDLRSHETLNLMDDTEIELNIKFNHRLDVRRYRPIPTEKSSFVYWDISVTAGGRLSPVIGSYFPALPRYMSISDVNWCYRVAFAEFDGLDEVEWLGSDARRIRPTDTIAYKPQFDYVVIKPLVQSVQIGFYTNNVYYFCVDLFEDHMQTASNDKHADMEHVVKSLTPLDEKGDPGPDTTGPISIAIIAALGSLIFVIVAYQVIRQSIRANDSRD